MQNWNDPHHPATLDHEHAHCNQLTDHKPPIQRLYHPNEQILELLAYGLPHRAPKSNRNHFQNIVHLTSPQGQEFSRPHDLEEWYKSLLFRSATDSNEKPSMIYMYHHVFTGFAAKMSVEQAKAMEKMKEVVAIRPESVFQLHTTRSPHFLGLHQNLAVWRDSNYRKGIIIGVLDTEITPGHPSFNDKGVSPPPARWKGKCEAAGCNNKLIGMRNFVPESRHVDEDGRGAHTSSTDAGSPVDNANVFGNAESTSTGIIRMCRKMHMGKDI